jgi:hypothetical protein
VAGPLFCKKIGIQYVDYNDVYIKLRKRKLHFIFLEENAISLPTH